MYNMYNYVIIGLQQLLIPFHWLISNLLATTLFSFPEPFVVRSMAFVQQHGFQTLPRRI